jgi:hypothetical protein
MDQQTQQFSDDDLNEQLLNEFIMNEYSQDIEREIREPDKIQRVQLIETPEEQLEIFIERIYNLGLSNYESEKIIQDYKDELENEKSKYYKEQEIKKLEIQEKKEKEEYEKNIKEMIDYYEMNIKNNEELFKRKIKILKPSKNIILKFFNTNKTLLNDFIDDDNVLFLHLSLDIENEINNILINNKKFSRPYNELKLYLNIDNKNYLFNKYNKIIEKLIEKYRETKNKRYNKLYEIIKKYIQENKKANNYNEFEEMEIEIDLIKECFDI